MSHLVKRTVKGALYYYLEESFKWNGKWVRESVYLGSQLPSANELLKAFEELKKKAIQKNHAVLVPPWTEFISARKAAELEIARKNKFEFLKKLPEAQRKEFLERDRITFITDSNAIEGSSLTYRETEQVLLQEKKFRKKDRSLITGMGREEQEAINLNNCLDRYEQYLKIDEPLSEKMILQLHFILLQDISGYEKYQGVYRSVQVFIRGSLHEFPLPAEVPHLMKELVQWYFDNHLLIHPVELAAKFHTKFTSVHPFADGNGRMARLLMNYILQQKEFPFTNIPLKRRSPYMQTQTAGNTNDYKPFTKFLADEVIAQHLEKSN